MTQTGIKLTYLPGAWRLKVKETLFFKVFCFVIVLDTSLYGPFSNVGDSS